MLDLIHNNYLKTIVNSYSDKNIEKSAINIRKHLEKDNGDFSIFDALNKMGIRTIIYNNDTEGPATGFIYWKEKMNVNYLILSSSRSVEEMRFDAACMLKKVLQAVSKKNTRNYNMIQPNSKFSREDKHFACAILMPKNELIKFINSKDENGNYKYLKDKGVLSFKFVNVIADHFGVPYDQCCSRIYNIMESYKKENKRPPFILENCINKKTYKELKNNYSIEQRNLDMEELVPNHSENRQKFVTCLIDSLHYRKWHKLSDVAKRRLLINLIASDSVNEGVIPITTTSEDAENQAKDILNHYIANNLKIRDGYLIGDDGSKILLTDKQLVVIGEYELYAKVLDNGLLSSYIKLCDDPKNFENMTYKEALNYINERDIAYFIKKLHAQLFKKISYKYGESRGGMYRSGSARLLGTNVRPADDYQIPFLMNYVCKDIIDLLRKNATSEMSNGEYLKEVNRCIYTIIRMQPFSDGNKRTARLLANILYQEKGIPYVFIPVKEWSNYVDAWSNDDPNKYNKFMNNLILESYNYFYGNQSIKNIIDYKNKGEKIIKANMR